ncbi:MAG: hypothetical protein IKW24_02130 [Clostridia bacterium]|nr:hypothetical protein [Clostridia bacterium]
MSRVDLPRYDWFVNNHSTNTFSGSLGTLPDQGCIAIRTFHYRVFVDTSKGKDESTYRLVAECYIIQPWDQKGAKTDEQRADFDASEQGIDQAGEWIGGIAAKFGF